MTTIKLYYIYSILVLFIATSFTLERGYGDWPKDYPMHPSMRERRVLVLTNACRISPTEYRDKLVVPYNSMASGILLPENYPPVDALYWQIDLNRVAKIHATDMANNHGLSHSSSDGTSFQDRVTSYYTKSPRIAENIACGSREAFGSMRQWILDIIDTNNTPAPDNSGDDGHRKGIMNARYQELGTGYDEGPIRWYYFWVQDFGGADPDFDNPISAGAHFVLSGNNTQFMCTYTDPGNADPKNTTVVIDDQEHALSVLFGAKKKGTYDVKLPTASDCRYYYFTFTDSRGRTWRHPEHGRLVTLGEGSCDEEYEYPDEIIFTNKNKRPGFTGYTIHAITTNNITLQGHGNAATPWSSTITNCKGQKIQRHDFLQNDIAAAGNTFIIPLDKALVAGLYFMTIHSSDQGTYSVKLYISGM